MGIWANFYWTNTEEIAKCQPMMLSEWIEYMRKKHENDTSKNDIDEIYRQIESGEYNELDNPEYCTVETNWGILNWLFSGEPHSDIWPDGFMFLATPLLKDSLSPGWYSPAQVKDITDFLDTQSRETLWPRYVPEEMCRPDENTGSSVYKMGTCFDPKNHKQYQLAFDYACERFEVLKYFFRNAAEAGVFVEQFIDL